tara:strand:+ start:3645 stop:4052 length:408 start_codon:yes stop_codon:yes gene_type:complete
MSNEKQQSSSDEHTTEDIQPTNTSSIEDELNNLNENADIGDLLKNLGNDENISNLFKQFTSGFSNLGQQNQPSNEDNSNMNMNDFLNQDDDDLDDIDLDSINLDKYFVSKNGDNICDILHDIKEQLVVFNKNSNK